MPVATGTPGAAPGATASVGPLCLVSYGGGTQSTALLVLAARGEIDFPYFVFADVGQRSEPRTHAYIREHAMPFAAAHGITLAIARRHWRDGRSMDLYGHIRSPVHKGVQIPVKLAGGAPGRRHCTVDYKVEVLRRWQRAHGASPENPAVVALGISYDELQRMRTNPDPDRVIVYPLLEHRLTRADCEAIIAAAGLPQPGRSSCFYCPFHTQAEWQGLRQEEPHLFWDAVALERHMAAKMAAEGEGPVTMHRKGPLLAITHQNGGLSGSDEVSDPCESGHCFV
jgi:hypothetical protein